jgi:hypothetical protein
MKPFTSIEEAQAELKDMSLDDIQTLTDVTNELLDGNQISEEQYNFVLTVILDEAMSRISRIVEEGLGSLRVSGMPKETDTIH